MLVWREGVGAGKGQGFDKESHPMVGTFDYCQVQKMRTFEFPLIMDAILD